MMSVPAFTGYRPAYARKALQPPALASQRSPLFGWRSHSASLIRAEVMYVGADYNQVKMLVHFGLHPEKSFVYTDSDAKTLISNTPEGDDLRHNLTGMGKVFVHEFRGLSAEEIRNAHEKVQFLEFPVEG